MSQSTGAKRAQMAGRPSDTSVPDSIARSRSATTDAGLDASGDPSAGAVIGESASSAGPPRSWPGVTGGAASVDTPRQWSTLRWRAALGGQVGGPTTKCGRPEPFGLDRTFQSCLCGGVEPRSSAARMASSSDPNSVVFPWYSRAY
jgi:hypothetical protein